ncbi:MAG: response regulator [Methanospirillum sp.]|uniref:histidine kinase dimerization/phosphoacceptor domain -containing protein n=1 Tax=Methanospirillum sp. TaxID=45200 RepID=UPI0023708117|nr:histidine kinase dimerization/phosphoacceptor domain -containing protein [Methanospirillum sp.]MDD1728615.1 response regulator [Methanospirillum sp.]
MTKVLLVDDELVLLDLGCQILEKRFGFSVETVGSGEEALNKLSSERFDAVISDYAMPGMDGLELLRRIREEDAQIPFVLFTVKEREKVAVEALNSGANFYVQKEESPHIAFTELAHKVNTAVELVRAENNLVIQRDLAIASANSREIKEILAQCLKAAIKTSFMDAAAIYLMDDHDHLSLTAVDGFSPEYSDHIIQAHLIPLFFSLLRVSDTVFRDQKTIQEYSRTLFTSENIHSDVVISLTHHGKPIGLIHLASHENDQELPTPLQRSLHGIVVQIAGHISDCIAEDALRESERMVNTLITNLPGMVYKCLFDEERTMEFVSEGSLALTGYHPSDLVQNQNPTYTSLIHPDDRPRIIEVIQRAVNRHAQFKLTYRIFTSSMKFKWVMEQGVGVYDENEDLIGLEGFIIDITRQKVLDDQVKTSQNRLNMLFSNMNAGCAIFLDHDGDGRFILIEMNAAAEIMEGRKKETLLGKTFQEYFGLSIPKPLNDALSNLLTYGKPQNLPQIYLNTPSGKKWREVYLSQSHIGNESEIFLIYSDVTSRVRDEEQIIASLHEKELLLKEIHHRVKNNLQVISGILKLQAMRTTDPVTTEILQDCRNQVFSMASIHELLYSSHDIGNINIKGYVENLINHLKQEYEGANSSIQYITEIDSTIVLDIERCIPCGLILNELITNAVKYAFEPEGKGEIRVTFTHHDHMYRMEISDNGRGMPKEKKTSGTSLGTELVNRLVHQLKGEIRYPEGPGTTITIVFNDNQGSG